MFIIAKQQQQKKHTQLTQLIHIYYNTVTILLITYYNINIVILVYPYKSIAEQNL